MWSFHYRPSSYGGTAYGKYLNMCGIPQQAVLDYQRLVGLISMGKSFPSSPILSYSYVR